MKIVYFKLFVLFILSLTIWACEEETIAIPTNVTQSASFFGDYGRFIVANMEAKDTVYIQDGGKEGVLKAKNGDRISIAFEAKEEYKNREFNSVYTLYDNSKVEDQQEHEFTIQNVEVGRHEVSLLIRLKGVEEINNSSKLILDVTE